MTAQVANPFDEVKILLPDAASQLLPYPNPCDEVKALLQDPTVLHPLQQQAVAELLLRLENGYTTLSGLTIWSNLWILANGVGTGKTRVTAALVRCILKKGLHLQPAPTVLKQCVYECNPYIHLGKCQSAKNDKILLYSDNPVLIVQWQHSLNLLGVTFSTCETKRDVKEVPEDANVILARGQGLRSILERYEDQTWAFLLYDEPDTQPCRFMTTDAIRAGSIVFITATPNNLKRAQQSGFGYSHHNLVRAAVKNADEEILKKITIKTVNNMEELGYKPPAILTVPAKCKKLRILGLVNDIVPNIASLIHQGDWNAVYTSLGVSVESPSLIGAVRKRLQDQLSRLTHEFHRDQYRIDNVQHKLATLEGRLKSHDSEGCVICTQDPLNNPTCTPCQHVFCGSCIGQWLSMHPNCPVCRAQCKLTDLVCQKEPESKLEVKVTKEEEPEITDKISTIVRIVKEQQEIHSSKVIVYGASDGGLQWIQKELAERNVIAVMLKGHSKSRKRAYSDFAEEETAQVLLLNSGKQAAGLDGLQNKCGCVVFYHDVDNKEQIVGRLNRIGQQREIIFVYELTY